jgi:hypothetical protein
MNEFENALSLHMDLNRRPHRYDTQEGIVTRGNAPQCAEIHSAPQIDESQTIAKHPALTSCALTWIDYTSDGA